MTNHTRYSWSKRSGWLLLLLAAAGPAGAALFNASGGQRYTGGSRGYWGLDAWGYGSVRLDGGWYPFGQLTLSRDSFYDGVFSPGAGLAKGFAGVGKARVGYTYHRGRLDDGDLYGSAHSLDLGFARFLRPDLFADAAYRYTNGDLFAGINRVLAAVATDPAATSLRHAVYHQAILSFGLGLSPADTGLSAMTLEGSAAAGAGSDGLSFYMQTVGLSAPVFSRLLATVAVTFTQSNRTRGRTYVGAGLSYSLAGRIR